MPRVALVTQSYHPIHGGVGEHVHHLALGLLARGHEVTVITGNGAARSSRNAGGAPVDEGTRELLSRGGRLARMGRTHILGFNGASVSLVAGPGLGRGLSRFDRRAFDLVHVHSPFEPLLPVAALAYFQAPKVGTFHSAGRYGWGYLPFLPLLGPIASQLSARVAVSKAARDYVARFLPGRYRIVPNGVDLLRFRADPTKRAEEPESGHGPRVLRVLALGRLDPRKGHRILLDAVACARRDPRVPPFELRVVGDGPLRSELETRAGDLGLPVRFLGSVDESGRRREYARADLFVAPATHGESFGIVLLEALAAGVPVLASSNPGYEAVLEGSGAAQLVRSGDTEEWGRSLARLLGSEDERASLASRAVRHAERYSWERLVGELETIYDEVLSGGRRTVGVGSSSVFPRAHPSVVRGNAAPRSAGRTPTVGSSSRS